MITSQMPRFGTKIITKAIGSHEDLLTTVKKRKLKWYGHITRSSGLAKTILQGTVRGKRKRRRQGRGWEDSITEWTGKALSDNLRRSEDIEKWLWLVTYAVMPLRSPGPRES